MRKQSVDQAKSSNQKESWIEAQEQWLFFLHLLRWNWNWPKTKYIILPVESMQAQETTKENIYNSVVVFAWEKQKVAYKLIYAHNIIWP